MIISISKNTFNSTSLLAFVFLTACVNNGLGVNLDGQINVVSQPKNVSNLDCGSTANGTSANRTKFLTSSVANGQRCKSETQSALCTNGVLGAFSGTYAFDSCSVAPLVIIPPLVPTRIAAPSGLNPLNGARVATGSSITISWNQVSGASGYLIRATRLLANGTETEAIPQNNSYQQTTFNLPVTPGNDYRFWVHAYDKNFNTGSGYIPANYSEATETVFTILAAPGACGSVLNGQSTSRTMYQAASVPSGQTCVSQTQTATCTNGVLGAYSGTFIYASCSAVVPPPPAEASLCANGSANAITKFGITWTFSTSRPCGNYVNGDYWVVGPVTVTAITKPNGPDRDGSMINPMPTYLTQGYDSRVPGYSTTLDDSTRLPLALHAGQSLVSSISRNPTDAAARPALLASSVLTVVASNPGADKFRPPFVGAAKPLYSLNNLRRNLLPKLAPVAKTPPFADTYWQVSAMPLIDHMFAWNGEHLHAEQAMPGGTYSANLARSYGDGVLRLMLDEPLENKETLLIRLVQAGIDKAADINNGANWGGIGGTMGVGRKFPIMFAGYMLNEPSMTNIASIVDPVVAFQEDGQTFYLVQESINAAHAHRGVADPYCINPTYYDGLPLGTPVWGNQHWEWLSMAGFDLNSWRQDPGKIAYDGITYGSTEGTALAARLLGLVPAWNHQAFFDWQDRFHAIGYWKEWASPFAASMWATYR